MKKAIIILVTLCVVFSSINAQKTKAKFIVPSKSEIKAIHAEKYKERSPQSKAKADNAEELAAICATVCYQRTGQLERCVDACNCLYIGGGNPFSCARDAVNTFPAKNTQAPPPVKQNQKTKPSHNGGGKVTIPSQTKGRSNPTKQKANKTKQTVTVKKKRAKSNARTPSSKQAASKRKQPAEKRRKNLR